MRQFTDGEKERLNKAKNDVNCRLCICRPFSNWRNCPFCCGLVFLQKELGVDWKAFVEGEDFQFERTLDKEEVI